ncbi:MAG: S46 family peptidase [Deltaproteobacteria bacterium]|nr:S46 family peptidase [Deltaproteobacteria bacterium]
MKRSAFVWGVLFAAACSGGSKQQNTGGVLGSSHDTSGANTTSGTSASVKTDPNLGFRQSFSNPGGMWMPQQMTLAGHVETFQKMGVKMDAKVLADPLAQPLNAIVSTGGCTASFVSADGLLVTNHHCIQGALKHNATPETNYVETGFLAKSRAEEMSSGPSAKIWVAQAFKDVTKEMRDGLEAIKEPNKRRDELEKRTKALVAACEKGRPGIKCKVSSFFRGGQYVQTENLEIKDLRLVYVPARSVGNYGGEIDNWAWPRHTGDFSFFRAYVGKDGLPAEYSKDNVPFKPKAWLKVSAKGLKPSDFVMVTGYPGGTNRTTSGLETQHDVEWGYPNTIAYFKDRYALAEQYITPKDPNDKAQVATSIAATVMKQGMQNGLEKFEGILKGLTSTDSLQKKIELDKQVKAWAAKPGNEKHKAAIDKLEQLIVEEQRTAQQDFDRRIAFGGSKLLGTALSLTRWAEERPKTDMERKLGYQNRDMTYAEAGAKGFLKQYDRTLDRAGFKLALTRAASRPEADRPWLVTLLGVKKGAKVDEALIDKTLESWYGATKLEDMQLRLDLLAKGTTAQLKASKDPFIQAAQRIWATYKAVEKKNEARSGELVLVTPYYADAMREVLGGLLAPDANSSLRITYGTVKSFKPTSKDAADVPFTTASQILAKDTGKEPFDAPKKQLELIKAKKYGPYADASLGGELPVDFLTDLDITGGNSGSPTLNDKGELVGLAFDGNTEGLASDVLFNGAVTRTIHVDARYMLWQMDAIDGADHLLKEMGIQPRL